MPHDPVAPQPEQRPLRVGLIVDSIQQRQWVLQVVAGVQTSGPAQIVLVVELAGPPANAPSWRRTLNAWRSLLFRWYEWLDARIYRRQPDAWAPASLSDLVSTVPHLKLAFVESKAGIVLADADVESIRKHGLDVLLAFNLPMLDDSILQTARHGVWSYEHGDGPNYRGPPAGFWEIMEASPTTGASLQMRRAASSQSRSIYRTSSATVLRSLFLNRNLHFWKSAAFVPRVLRELADRGPASLDEALPEAPGSRPARRVPNNWQMLWFLARLGFRNLRRIADRVLFQHEWYLAYHLSNETAGPALDVHRFRDLLPPKDRFWADPFPVHHGDSYYIFVEECPYGSPKGYIAVIEMAADGTWKPPVKVLERDYHLSYPFVFRYDDAWYMIPETYDAGRIELFRCVEFPTRWQFEKALMDNVGAVDVTLHQCDGRWWMFANTAPYGGFTWDELHIFYADSPLGPWTGHRRNPVKSDVRSTRPAGRLFEQGGRLIRPAQDCSVRYGYATVLNEVQRLTSDDYEEIEVARILPDWRKDLLATHTINWADGLTVIDAMRRRSRWL